MDVGNAVRHYRDLLRAGGELADRARAELELWLRALRRVTEGEVALIVSHGGSTEPTLVAAMPDAHVSTWGPPFSHLDGVRLAFDNERCLSLEFHRYRR
jgi:broad specificity phosphatase PhoE